MNLIDPAPYFAAFFKTNYFLPIFFGVCGIFLIWGWRQMPLLTSRQLLILAFVIGLGLRFFWVAYSSHRPNATWDKMVSENDWININAIDLTQGIWFQDSEGNPSIRRPIGYPIVLGLAYKIFGVHRLVALVLHFISYISVTYLLYRMGCLLASKRAGAYAALGYSLFPTAIYMVNLITDEQLFIPLFLFGLYLTLRELSLKKLRPGWLSYGLVFGVTALTRPYGLLLPAILAAGLTLRRVPWIRLLKTISLTSITIFLLAAPWAVRNIHAFGVPVFYGLGSHVLLVHTNSKAVPERSAPYPVRGEPGYVEGLTEALRAGNEGLIEKYSSLGWKLWVLEHPVEFLTLGTAKVLYFLHWGRQKNIWPLVYEYESGAYDPAKPLDRDLREALEEFSYIFYYVVFHMFLGSLAVIVSRRRRYSQRRRILIDIAALGLFLFCLSHTISSPDPKYRYPIEVLMILFAGLFAAWLEEAGRLGIQHITSETSSDCRAT